MHKDDFLLEAEPFAQWLVRILKQGDHDFHHRWTSSGDSKVVYPTGHVCCFVSLYDAYALYRWRPGIRGTYLETFGETTDYLGQIATDLNAAMIESDGDRCHDYVRAILRWGGVEHRSGEKLRNMPADSLPAFLSGARDYFNNTEDTEVLPEIGDVLVIDSGTTKVYSLLAEDFVMYDARVGAALGLLVRCWVKSSPNLEPDDIPDPLRFAWDDNWHQDRRTEPEMRHNPNWRYENTDIFPRFGDDGVDRRVHNMFANWLLAHIIDIDKDLSAAEKSGFARLPVDRRLRALEAALFMIGYSVNPMYSPPCPHA